MLQEAENIATAISMLEATTTTKWLTVERTATITHSQKLVHSHLTNWAYMTCQETVLRCV